MLYSNPCSTPFTGWEATAPRKVGRRFCYSPRVYTPNLGLVRGNQTKLLLICRVVIVVRRRFE